MNFRPTAIPLITNDPFQSIWSFTDKLTDDHTRHWTGHSNSMFGVLFVDEKPFRFIYDPENTRIEIIESTDKEATALVYFDFIEGDKTVSTPVECKFSKGYSLWMLEDSQIIDLLTNPDEFVPAPDTGDNAFDKISLCLGGMAALLSAVCIVTKKRRISTSID